MRRKVHSLYSWHAFLALASFAFMGCQTGIHLPPSPGHWNWSRSQATPSIEPPKNQSAYTQLSFEHRTEPKQPIVQLGFVAVDEKKSKELNSGQTIIPVSAQEPIDTLPALDPPPSMPNGAVPPVATSPTLTGKSSRNDAQMLMLDLPQVLEMASGNNLQMALARERIREAMADQKAAEVLWLPSVRFGMTYNKHEGTLQESSGRVIDVSRSSLMAGAGVFAVGAGSPMIPGLYLNLGLNDALFQPKIAQANTAARQDSAHAVTNATLLQVSLTYLDLLNAVQEKAIARQIVAKAKDLADLTASFARNGQGPQADADRALAELKIRENDVIRAEERQQVVAARLSELLHLPGDVQIFPGEEIVIPLALVQDTSDLRGLLATGLANRPELSASRNLVSEALYRLKREKTAPLLPSMLLGASYGGFGGSPSPDIINYRDRFDLDAGVYWEIRNLGLGELAARQSAQSRLEQSRVLELQMMDQVAREISQARSQVQARSRQIDIAKQSLVTAQNALKRDLQRITEGEGLPVEALQSLQLLNQAQREYLRVVTDFNEAQFRLQWALGWAPGPIPTNAN